jgi:hypothetical protein
VATLRKTDDLKDGKRFRFIDQELDGAAFGPVGLRDPRMAKIMRPLDTQFLIVREDKDIYPTQSSLGGIGQYAKSVAMVGCFQVAQASALVVFRGQIEHP